MLLSIPAAALVTALVLSGCTAPAPAPVDCAPFDETPHDQMLHVEMKDMAFNPKDATVAPGTWVMWINGEDIGHTVTPVDAGLWGTEGSGSSPDQYLMEGDVWAHCFTTVGEYPYYCIPHATRTDSGYVGMVGSITVEA